MIQECLSQEFPPLFIDFLHFSDSVCESIIEADRLFRNMKRVFKNFFRSWVFSWHPAVIKYSPHRTADGFPYNYSLDDNRGIMFLLDLDLFQTCYRTGAVTIHFWGCRNAFFGLFVLILSNWFDVFAFAQKGAEFPPYFQVEMHMVILQMTARKPEPHSFC